MGLGRSGFVTEGKMKDDLQTMQPKSAVVRPNVFGDPQDVHLAIARIEECLDDVPAWG